MPTTFEHPLFKLGQLKRPKSDPRDLNFAGLLKAKPAIPKTYSFDKLHPGIPRPMFANDVHGDCVMAARGHHTLRMELVEKGVIPKITDQEILNEYFKETGGPQNDTGLVIADSLKAWRTHGWTAGGILLKIKAYAAIKPLTAAMVRQAIYLDLGVEFGLALPQTAATQIDHGKEWTVAKGTGTAPGSWGGHCTGDFTYDATSLTVITWGMAQAMDDAFFAKYCQEAWVVFDDKDATPKQKKHLRIDDLDAYLEKLKKPAA